MSRREKEFKKRTSIFEGAFRAWSFLNHLDPETLHTKSVYDIDPLDGADFLKSKNLNADGSPSPECPYVPLPRSGLEHPFVMTILDVYMGTCTNDDVYKVALSQLRTWWHHRRGGLNKTALKYFENEMFRNLVDTYTRHFFKKAHFFVAVQKAQPPRGLAIQMKQKKMLLSKQGTVTPTEITPKNSIDALGDSIPENVKLHGIDDDNKAENKSNVDSYCIPIVYESSSGELHILLQVEGITSAHCARILETVLLGCNGRGTPIMEFGLQDVAADENLATVIIKIDRMENAQRIAFESCRNFSMVGYEAKPKELNKTSDKVDPEAAFKVFSWVAMSDPVNFFNWNTQCTCPDCGIFRNGCERHSQINVRLMDSFRTRELLIRNNIPSAMDTEDLMEGPIVDDDVPLQVDQVMRFDFPPSEDQQHSTKSQAPSNNFISLTDAIYEALITNNDRRQDTLSRQLNLSSSQQFDDSMTPYSIDWGVPKHRVPKSYQGDGGEQA